MLLQRQAGDKARKLSSFVTNIRGDISAGQWAIGGMQRTCQMRDIGFVLSLVAMR
jgi:hypothetical protein